MWKILGLSLTGYGAFFSEIYDFSDLREGGIEQLLNPMNINIPSLDEVTIEDPLSFIIPKDMDYGEPTKNVTYITIDEVPEGKEYKYIIVGGGGVGCPVAGTLAENGDDVLIIERGGLRADAPTTWNIKGAGHAINDPTVSQTIITTQGIRTHVGSVLSGGTATHMGIMIDEKPEFFEWMESEFSTPGNPVQFKQCLMEEAYTWVRDRLSSEMAQDNDFGTAVYEALVDAGYIGVEESPVLVKNSVWKGYTIFNSAEDFFREASDRLLGGDPDEVPTNLDILTNNIVERVIFEQYDDGSAPKAKCVVYRTTTPEDVRSINSRKVNFIFDWTAIMTSLMDPITKITKMFTSAWIDHFPPMERTVCVQDDGEIILAAGAIFTPVVLFKSGVGPQDQIDELGVPMIIEHPTLGKTIRDRPFLPIGVFLKEQVPARITQALGNKPVGPGCPPDFTVGSESLTCSLAAIEQLSGSQIAEGAIYATRFVFPPEQRDDALVEYLLQVAEQCAEGKVPFNDPMKLPLCYATAPMTECFQRVGAVWNLISEAKSIGSIWLSRSGDMTLDGNYLGDPQDMEDMKRGIAKVVEVLQNDAFQGTVEAAGEDSCDRKILFGITEFMTQMDMRVRQYIPPDNFYRMEQFLFNQEWLTMAEKLVHLEETSGGGGPSNSEGGLTTESQEDLKYLEPKYATYPPTLPDPTDDAALEAFARSWLTSIWHWSGSARMGEVVDKEFRVVGADGLRIIDASVWPALTRMNPVATFQAMGHYAAKLIIEEHGGAATC